MNFVYVASLVDDALCTSATEQISNGDSEISLIPIFCWFIKELVGYGK